MHSQLCTLKKKIDVDIVEKREKGEVVNWTLQFFTANHYFYDKSFFL